MNYKMAQTRFPDMKMTTKQMKDERYVVVEPQDEKEEKKERKLSLALLPMGGNKMRGNSNRRTRLKLFHGGIIQVNANPGKYIQSLGGAATYGWTNVSNCGEWTNIDAIYDEFFIRSVKLHYFSRNKYSSNSTSSGNAAGSPGDLNTCMATICGLYHNAATFADSSSAFFFMRQAQVSKSANMADDWTISQKNLDKFAWDGPMADQSTATAATGWLQISKAGTITGNFFQLSTPAASGAAIGVGTLLELGVFGDFIAEYDVCLRARA